MRTILVSLLVFLSIAVRAQDEEPAAQLSIQWDVSGDDAFVWFSAEDAPEGELLRALSDALPCDTLESSNIDLAYFGGTCAGLLSRNGLTQSGKLDLRLLREALIAHDVDSLFVTLSHQGLPLVRLVGAEWHGDDAGWSGGDYAYFELELAAAPETVFVEWGYDGTRIRRGLGFLAIVFFAPIVWTLFHRRRVLAQETFDEDAGWFAYWRQAHWMSLGVFFVWVACLVTYSFWGVLGFLLSDRPSFWHHATALGGLVLPPLASTTICQLLSIPILDHLRGTKGVGRRLVRASLLTSTLSWLPFLFVVVGVLALFEDLRLGLGLIVLSVLARLAMMALLARDEDFMPHAVTVGELRDRLFALAKTLGVEVKQLYVLPAVEARMANAFAVQGGNVILTDFLLRNLDKSEVDGIVGHELAHLRHHHPFLLTLSFLGGIGVVIAALYAAPLLGLPPVLPGMQVLVAGTAGVLVFLHVSRRFELTADADAVLLTGDHEAMIRGLAKLTKANLLPRQWGRFSKFLLTHPSLEQRAKAIASRSSLTEVQVQESLAAESGASEPYALPDGVGSDTVYSTRFKTKVMTQNSLALIALMVLAPALVALSVEAFGITGGTRWVVFAAGAILGSVLLVLAADRLAASGQPLLRRQLSAKLEKQGLDMTGGVFVGYAPHHALRLYENFTVWDVGFVFFDAERLVYLGDHTRFEIPRERVEQIELQDGMPSWHRMKRVYLRAGERHIAWNIPDVGSVSGGRKVTEALFQRLERWHAGDNVPSGVELPEDLPAPQTEDVTSESPRSAVEGNKILSTVMMVGVTAILANALLGLDLLTTGWFVVTASILSSLVLMFPLFRYKDSR